LQYSPVSFDKRSLLLSMSISDHLKDRQSPLKLQRSKFDVEEIMSSFETISKIKCSSFLAFGYCHDTREIGSGG
jgi:hypothetical protein